MANHSDKAFEKDTKNKTKAKDGEPMFVDDVLDYFGRYGRVQMVVFLQISYYMLISAWHALGISFLGATPDHHCKVPPDSDYIIPVEYNANGEKVIDKCHLLNITSNDLVKCPYGWWYSDESTIVAEWDLVCDKTILVQTSQAVYMGARMVGALIAPTIADYVGRKYVVIICGVVWGVIGIIVAFVDDFILFTVLRGAIAASEMGGLLVAYCLVSEYYSTRHRAFAANGIYLSWAVGLMTLPGIAYLVPNWRYLQLIISAPLLLIATGYWTIPESIHYLVAQGRLEEAADLVIMKAKFSRISLPEGLKLKAPQEEQLSETNERTKNNLIGVALTPYLRTYAFFMVLVWFVNALVYFGLSLGTNTLAGNRYLNFFLSGVIEIPAYAACMYLLKPWGRRIPTLALHVIAGLPLLITYFIPEKTGDTDLSPLITTLNLIGKFGITATFSAIYLITSEIYPTVVRNAGLGVSSFFARVGSAIAPFTVYFKETAPAVQPMLFGTLAIAAGVIIMFVPETGSRNLPETLAEYEDWVTDKERKKIENCKLNNQLQENSKPFLSTVVNETSA